MHVEHYVRQPDGGWLLREVAEPDSSVALDSISVILPVSEIYRQVTLKDERGTKGQSDSG